MSRSALMLRRRLAHVRSRLVGVLRRARRCPVRFLRRRMPHVVRDGGILRPRSLSVIRMRCALSCRRTRNIRCAIAVGSRLGLVHVSRRMRRFPGRFRGRRMTRVVRNRGVVRVRSGCCVRPSSILPCWRMRNGVVGVRNIVRGGRALAVLLGWPALACSGGRGTLPLFGRELFARFWVFDLRSSDRRDVVHGRILRCYHTRTVEGRWFGGCCDLRPSMIHRRPL